MSKAKSRPRAPASPRGSSHTSRRRRTLAGYAKALAALPEVELHPLRLYLLRRGVTFVDGARCLGLSLRTLMAVVCEWHRPGYADAIAEDLGEDPDVLFPRR